MKKRLPLIFYIIPVLLTFFTLIVLQSFDTSVDAGNREAAEGKLTLTEYDLNMEEGIRLNGEWEFYSGQLLEPEDFSAGTAGKKSYIAVPGSWEGQLVDGEPLSSKGYGTYRLTVQLPPTDKTLGLATRLITSAHRIWINGEPAAANGIVGTSRETATPLIIPRLVHVNDAQDGIDIVIQVSNFTQRKAGLFAPVVLGEYSNLDGIMKQKLAIEGVLMGCMLIMGLYHIVLFVLLRRNPESLLFGLICILLALKNSSQGQVTLALFFHSITDNLLVKIEYIGFLGSAPLFVLFIYSSFPGQMPKWLRDCLWVPGALLTLIIVATPVYIYTKIVFVMQIYAVVTAFILIQYIFKAAIRGMQGATLMAVGSVVFFITVANDILMSNGMIRTGIYFPYGMLFLIICLSIILSLKFSTAFKTIERLSTRLLDLDKVKDEFLTNTSHELRTPLNGMIGLAQSLLYNMKGKLTDNEELHLNMIVSSGQRMAYLINDILDYSRLNNNDIRLSITNVDLHQLVQVVLTVVKPLTAGRDLLLINEIKPGFPSVQADENRLQQIIFNLVGNAIKYTPSGQVRIGAAYYNDFVEIAVEDTGIGIPEDRFEDIFKPFEQLDGQGEAGSGLGLKITKQLVELHDGQIKVQSKLGSGSRFSFMIRNRAVTRRKEKPPMLRWQDVNVNLAGMVRDEEIAVTVEKEPPLIIDKDSGSPAQQPYRLLVVDDEPVNLQVVIQQLAPLNCVVDTAASGEQIASRLSELQAYDLVIADLMMPGMSGYDLCLAIRKSYTLYELPILIMTASNREDTIVAGFSAGANDYISKPFGRNELLSRVRTLLLLKRAVQEVSLNAEELAKLNLQLTELNTGLEQRIQERTLELEQTNEVLEHKHKELYRLELARRRLLSDVSHELRTPMTAIQGYVEAIVSGLVEETAVKERYLQMVLSKAIGLNRLIQDLFELSRLESRRSEMIFEIIPLNKLMALIKDKFALDVAQAGLEYDFVQSFDSTLLDDCQVVIDLDRIIQVLTNLVFNAIQHTPAGGRIAITCEVAEGQNVENSIGQLVIRVQDTGKGIHGDSLPLVFDRFYREQKEGRSSDSSGSGIGLAIAKEIVQYHDGVIEVESTVGQGSAFSFTLPLYRF
ncbi:response regulator [Paenibacillus oenotherae]|uniref:histidine kinase n=1 Tax=Paenibacillus oenotherae TaxID=1435645 RepID=A0ABS7D3J7_9BACL|nr:ATP-binding protein [Paenibacillus oenotherae]MBW7474036.1 response regulator [Paenibacillus oenotherae]